MPTIKETIVYKFNELSDSAKERAIEIAAQNMEFCADSVIDDAKEFGKLFGLDIDKIYYSGFYHQGSGASFEGNYGYAVGGLKAVKEFAPNDNNLHNIVEQLQEIQSKHFYALTAYMETGYSDNMRVNVDDTRELYVKRDVDENIKELMTDYAHWIFKQLEKEYEYQFSAEQIGEYLEANEFDFDEDGNFA